jgi:L-lactate dehydrogenase complex protein LldG
MTPTMPAVPTRPAMVPLDDLITRFEVSATAAGSVVHRLRSLAEVAELARSLADGTPILVTSEVAADTRLVAELGDVMTTDDAAQAADRPVGVERGVLAVAETGSVLVREPDRRSRLASMLARTLVQVVATDTLVDSLDEAGAWLAAHAAEGYAALITGPSRTADIERVLTVGVQGPAVLHVVLVDEPADPDGSGAA